MDLLTFSLNNIFALLQQMSVFLVIAYLFTKSPFFKTFHIHTLNWRQLPFLYCIFTVFSILGTYFGLPINDAIANTRAIGAVLAGIIGGPLLGGAVGFTAGLHRFSLGGFTAFSCGLSTTTEGLLGGLVHILLVRRYQQHRLLCPWVAFFTTLVAEITQMVIILIFAQPFDDALALVRIIALPMILANSTGAAIFVSIIRDQRKMYDELSVTFSAKALKMAEKTIAILSRGFDMETAREVASVIREETGVGAVAITDKEKVLAFVGEGDDHHLVGYTITSSETLQAIREDRIVYADGGEKKWRCNRSENCPLGSVLCVPLRVDNELVGTINLFEPKNKLFLVTNKTLGEGITKLLSDQILYSRYVEQKTLLTRAELKLAQAQVNPHFLFNALNTIIAITRKDADRARDLLMHLSNFFRKNLKRTGDLATLEEELNHVQSYLVIEKARFEDKLQLEIDIDPTLLSLKLPVFTLQPIVENAIKHGISNMLGQGLVRLSAKREPECVRIVVEDNGGNFEERGKKGLGMSIVEKRIKNLCGEQHGVTISFVPQERTTIEITLPAKGCSE
ncbi:sensor histidine kinase [Desulfopila aestuarii]|uniref:histidine kinase n=1 Tax=Desulfopila aestuarii DSM 18488 TaxID=1121416 RepID=A0A1M7XVM4_9BACT|nr:sensor histidine kinase [Desulfopila aestuarii]SHO42686.1 two-component system, LytT family, sensor kinase [Desulfopila aestuarii DSM 18488]